MRTVLAIALFVVTLAFGQEAPGDAGRSHPPAHERAQEATHEEGGETTMPYEVWWKWANLAVLVGVLWFLLHKPIGTFFESRTAEIQKGIRDAAQVRADAEARAAEIESKISNLSGEIERIRAAAKAEIATEGARIQTETEAQLTKIQAQAEAEIASATKQASVELKAHAAQLALQIAENQIRQKLDPRLQEDLANVFVNDLRQEGSAAAGSVQ